MSVYSVLTKRKGSSIENTQPIRRPRIDVDSDLIVIGSSPSTNEKIRAMPEQCRIAEQFLREDQYNTDAWVVLLDHAAQATPIDEISRNIFNTFLRLFPTVARFWCQYIQMEIAAENHDAVDALFKKSLTGCPDVKLHAMHLSYLESRHKDDLLIVEEAYQTAISRLGQEYGALPIWQSYISFLSSIPAPTPADEIEKTSRIRSIYQRAVIIPMKDVDLLWRAYDSFEYHYQQTGNQTQGIQSDISQKYQYAVTNAAKRRHLHEQINKMLIPRPFTVSLAKTTRSKAEHIGTSTDILSLAFKPSNTTAFSGSIGQGQTNMSTAMATPVLSPYRVPTHATSLLSHDHIMSWLRLLKFERMNMMRLPQAALHQRISLFFEQAAMFLLHFPEFWHAWASYENEMSSQNGPASDRQSVVKVYNKAIEAMPYSPLPTLLLAEFLEECSLITEARKAYSSLLITERAQRLLARAKDNKGALDNTTEGDGTMKDVDLYGPFSALTPMVLEQTPIIAYIQLMRFNRRVGNIDDARKVFKAATRVSHCSWEVYSAAADLEVYAEQALDQAREIYRIALDRFPASPELVLSYIQFLDGIQDRGNLVVLYERSITSVELREADALGWAKIASEYVKYLSKTCVRLNKIEQFQYRRNSLLGLIDAGVQDGTLVAITENKMTHTGHDESSDAISTLPTTTNKEPANFMSNLYLSDIIERLSYKSLTPFPQHYVELLNSQTLEKIITSKKNMAATEEALTSQQDALNSIQAQHGTTPGKPPSTLNPKKVAELGAFLENPPIMRTIAMKSKLTQTRALFPRPNIAGLIPYSRFSTFSRDNSFQAVEMKSRGLDVSIPPPQCAFMRPEASRIISGYPALSNFLWTLPSIPSTEESPFVRKFYSIFQNHDLPPSSAMLANYHPSRKEFLTEHFPVLESSLENFAGFERVERLLGYGPRQIVPTVGSAGIQATASSVVASLATIEQANDVQHAVYLSELAKFTKHIGVGVPELLSLRQQQPSSLPMIDDDIDVEEQIEQVDIDQEIRA